MLTLKSVSIGIGLMMIFLFLPFIFNYKGWKKEIGLLLKDTKIVRLCGFVMMIMAFLILRSHYTFEKDWPVMISIFGWLMLLKSLVYMWFPKFPQKKYDWLTKKHEWILVVAGVIAIGIGIFYEYVGFYIF